MTMTEYWYILTRWLLRYFKNHNIYCISFRRTKNDRKPQSIGVKDTDTVSPTIIIIVIMTMMFLCTYYTFGRHRTNHFGNDRNVLYKKSTATVIDLDKSETSVSLRQQRIIPTEAVSNSIGDQQSSRFRLAKHSWIGASESQSRVWSSVMWSKLAAHKTDPYSADRDREDVTDRTVKLWDINRLILLFIYCKYSIWLFIVIKWFILYVPNYCLNFSLNSLTVDQVATTTGTRSLMNGLAITPHMTWLMV